MGNSESHQGRAGPTPGQTPLEVPIFEIKQDIQDDLAIEEAPVLPTAEPVPEPGACGGGLSVGAAAHDVDTASSCAAGADAPAGRLGSGNAAAVGSAAEGLLRELHEYHLTKHTLGEGAFAKVRLATSQNTGHQVAVKIIKRKKLDERAEMLLQREVQHHQTLRHENIVRLHTWIKGPTKYYLVMEYCPGGDLLQYVNRAGRIDDSLARRLFRNLMEGISFCHALGLHHRDLKLENLMLSSCDPEQMQIKIADFGLSDLQTSPGGLSGTLCGSPLYAAPELMTEGAALDGYDASRSDIWSCGVILYALLASALPFDADDIRSLVMLIQSGTPTAPLPEERGPLAHTLVSRMLSVESKARPSASEVLKDEWMEGAPQTIRNSLTTIQLPTNATSARASARRRGASETTQFFKQMLARERAAARELSCSPSGRFEFSHFEFSRSIHRFSCTSCAARRSKRALGGSADSLANVAGGCP